MSFIKNRLRRIEEAARGGACPECELRPDGPGYITYHEDEGRPENADERCPRCGRHLWTVIRVVEVGADPTEGGGDAQYP